MKAALGLRGAAGFFSAAAFAGAAFFAAAGFAAAFFAGAAGDFLAVAIFEPPKRTLWEIAQLNAPAYIGGDLLLLQVFFENLGRFHRENAIFCPSQATQGGTCPPFA
jgi:hypothetical protein